MSVKSLRADRVKGFNGEHRPSMTFNGFNEAQRPSRGSKASKVRLAGLEVDREILRPSICRKRFKGGDPDRGVAKLQQEL